MSEKKQGQVKWFNNSKGFGFIIADDKEYFVHYNHILCDGYKSLNEGDTVKFKAAKSDKGICAEEVEVV